MTYNIAIGAWEPWHVGPFTTAIAAQHWAEIHGLDTWRLVEVEDPAEAPGLLAAMREYRANGVMLPC
jgi:hypothetical protein